MVLTSLRIGDFFQFAENADATNLYLARAAGQPIRRRLNRHRARISAHCLRIRLVRFDPVAIVQ
jgi:hypothetical protein